MQNIREKANFIHNLFSMIGKDLREVLDNCEEFDLYAFNVESYAVYCAVFGEIKLRVSNEMIQRENLKDYPERFAQNLMQIRFANIENVRNLI